LTSFLPEVIISLIEFHKMVMMEVFRMDSN